MLSPGRDLQQGQHPLSTWHEELAQIIPLRQPHDARSPERRRGCLRRQQLGSITICRVDCTSAQLRSVDPIGLAQDLLILRQEKGSMRLMAGQEHSVLKPEDLAVIDCRYPIELRADAPVSFMILQVRFTRGVADFTGLSSSGSTRIDSSRGSGAVASTFVEKFCEEGENLPEDIVDSLIRSLVGVLDTAAFEASNGFACSKQQAFSIQRIKHYISDNLRDPELNPTSVARELGVSRRNLDELFKHESTTISRYIWSRRLEGCQRDLEDPRYSGRRITEIAFSWGFNSASHFSRTFNGRFKMSPSQARTRAVSSREQRHRQVGVAAG